MLALYLLNWFAETQNIFEFVIIPRHYDGADNWNDSSWKTRAHLLCMVRTSANHDIDLVFPEYSGLKAGRVHIFLTEFGLYKNKRPIA